MIGPACLVIFAFFFAINLFNKEKLGPRGITEGGFSCSVKLPARGGLKQKPLPPETVGGVTPKFLDGCYGLLLGWLRCWTVVHKIILGNSRNRPRSL